jgi:hypothetical protein
MMAIDPSPETLMKINTELNVVRAQHNDLTLKIRHRELVEIHKAEAVTFARARRVRDQLLSAPARHAAILAAELGLPAVTLVHALDHVIHASLREISRRPRPTQESFSGTD